ncbi:unnamed protein product [Amoebophrya sp. A25]|nr:unnamed protein product [Amoebophrya sp. A25]|eukprot:GSA25T00010990001.1
MSSIGNPYAAYGTSDPDAPDYNPYLVEENPYAAGGSLAGEGLLADHGSGGAMALVQDLIGGREPPAPPVVVHHEGEMGDPVDAGSDNVLEAILPLEDDSGAGNLRGGGSAEGGVDASSYNSPPPAASGSYTPPPAPASGTKSQPNKAPQAISIPFTDREGGKKPILKRPFLKRGARNPVSTEKDFLEKIDAKKDANGDDVEEPVPKNKTPGRKRPSSVFSAADRGQKEHGSVGSGTEAAGHLDGAGGGGGVSTKDSTSDQDVPVRATKSASGGGRPPAPRETAKTIASRKFYAERYGSNAGGGSSQANRTSASASSGGGGLSASSGGNVLGASSGGLHLADTPDGNVLREENRYSSVRVQRDAGMDDLDVVDMDENEAPVSAFVKKHFYASAGGQHATTVEKHSPDLDHLSGTAVMNKLGAAGINYVHANLNADGNKDPEVEQQDAVVKEELNRKLKLLDAQIDRFKRENEQCKKLRLEREALMRSTEAERKKLKEEVERERAAMIAEIDDEREKLRKERSRIHGEREKHRKQVAETKAELSSAEQLSKQLKEVKDETQQKEARYRRTIERLQRQNEELLKKNNELTEDLAWMNKQVEKMSQQGTNAAGGAGSGTISGASHQRNAAAQDHYDGKDAGGHSVESNLSRSRPGTSQGGQHTTSPGMSASIAANNKTASITTSTAETIPAASPAASHLNQTSSTQVQQHLVTSTSTPTNQHVVTSTAGGGATSGASTAAGPAGTTYTGGSVLLHQHTPTLSNAASQSQLLDQTGGARALSASSAIRPLSFTSLSLSGTRPLVGTSGTPQQQHQTTTIGGHHTVHNLTASSGAGVLSGSVFGTTTSSGSTAMSSSSTTPKMAGGLWKHPTATLGGGTPSSHLGRTGAQGNLFGTQMQLSSSTTGTSATHQLQQSRTNANGAGGPTGGSSHSVNGGLNSVNGGNFYTTSSSTTQQRGSVRTPAAAVSQGTPGAGFKSSGDADVASDILSCLPVLNEHIADPHEIPTEKHAQDGRLERIYKDGRREILFTNGLKKVLWPDNRCTVLFTNGDTKHCLSDGTVIYRYAETSATQTTFSTGIEVFQFASGQIERHFPTGEKEIRFANGTTKKIFEDGHEEIRFPDGVLKHVPPKNK